MKYDVHYCFELAALPLLVRGDRGDFLVNRVPSHLIEGDMLERQKFRLGLGLYDGLKDYLKKDIFFRKDGKAYEDRKGLVFCKKQAGPFPVGITPMDTVVAVHLNWVRGRLKKQFVQKGYGKAVIRFKSERRKSNATIQ